MKTWQTGQRVRIRCTDRGKVIARDEDPVYLICGTHSTRGMWLSVEDDTYDGYTADVIVHDDTSGDADDPTYHVVLQDSRGSLSPRVVLVAA